MTRSQINLHLKNDIMWFSKLMGFEEDSPDKVKENITIEGEYMISRANAAAYRFGMLEVTSLLGLKNKVSPLESYNSKISLEEVVGDVQKLHCDPDNLNALFQAASQFNLLEMTSPEVTPEQGVGIYQYDHTQGPACAIACGAGTIYRNYFAYINGRSGQSAHNQIDCLDLIGKALGNDESSLWQMRNGYALLTKNGLSKINASLSNLNDQEWEQLKEKLKIGLQWNTEVTIAEYHQLVSQAYCSALPISYCGFVSDQWKKFAQLILEATYEATLYAALYNLKKTNCHKVFLTLVGGGAFGTDINWIIESISKALRKFKNAPLDVKIVSYGHSNEKIRKMIDSFEA